MVVYIYIYLYIQTYAYFRNVIIHVLGDTHIFACQYGALRATDPAIMLGTPLTNMV